MRLRQVVVFYVPLRVGATGLNKHVNMAKQGYFQALKKALLASLNPDRFSFDFVRIIDKLSVHEVFEEHTYRQDHQHVTVDQVDFLVPRVEQRMNRKLEEPEHLEERA